ncbi:hypothetical protein GCM10009839_32480 [Catenulispora yoronensis]|uniref:Dolichyl-phosphate-mannose-protein mannosyltransferase n=1 Tax=Catenulispora yoronensis TaxID=450799 RepID=A0ABP5FRZ4_9ACTN
MSGPDAAPRVPAGAAVDRLVGSVGRLGDGLRRGARVAQAHPASSTGLAWTLLILLRLFVGGMVGLADNYDGHRLMCQLGVAPEPIPDGQSLWAFAAPRYDAYTWYGEACSAGGTGQPYLTTAVIPLWIAKVLTTAFGAPLFGPHDVLDLRVLGVVYAALVGVALGWCVRELPGSVWVRVVVASGIGVVASDSAIAPDFISPLSDPAGVIGLLFVVPALLRLLRVETVRWREIAAMVAVALWTVGAKTQMVSVLVAVVPALLMRPTAIPAAVERLVRGAGGRWAKPVSAICARALGAAACLVLVMFAVGFQMTQPRWLNEIVLYNGVFQEILGHSDDVPGDLRALGLSPTLASAAGATIVSSDSAATLPAYSDFLDHASFDSELRFYATHPTRLIGVADRGLIGLSKARPPYLGTYPAGSGHQPYAKECRVCVAEAAFTMAEPFRWIVFPALWLGSIAVGMYVAVRGRRCGAALSTGYVLMTASLASAAQFWIVMFSEGDSDVAKHMVFTVFGICLLGPLLLAALVGFDQATATATDPRLPDGRVRSEAEAEASPALSAP